MLFLIRNSSVLTATWTLDVKMSITGKTQCPKPR